MEATSQWPVLSHSPTPMLPKLEISTSPLPVPFTALPSSPALEVIPTSLQAGGSSRPSSPIRSSSLPITDVALLPTPASLEVAYSEIDQPNAAPHTKISWCRNVLLLLERHSSLEPDAGPSQVTDKSILALAQTAAYILSELKNKHPEAKYLRATLAVSGALPDFVKHSRRKAFREFEASANGGFHQAWFNLGREYESVGDDIHAADCFNKGVTLDVASCLYRMGIAHVLGQLNVPQDVSAGLSLLHRAATLSSLNSPQPAYAFALILLGEFPLVSIPEELIQSLIPPNSSPALEAKSHLERAAYLHYSPAQYKLGLAYEFAQYPWPYDPLSSVEWYRMAGTMEAEMALSKWFLCGAEGAFEADERLAWVFAEKAASKGLVTAEFAMGYYCEVGVGGNKNLDQAIEWYRKASGHGDSEASARLDALNLPTPSVLSRVEHNALTGERLVRRRTHARMESEARAKTYPPTSQPRDHSRVLENIRQETISEGMYPERVAVPPTPPRTPDSSSPTLLAPQMPGRQRFSLVDPGFNSATTPPASRSSSPSSSPSFRPPGRRTPTRTPSQNSEVPSDEVRKTAPVTFADMGIGSVTLAQDSKSDCVLM